MADTSQTEVIAMSKTEALARVAQATEKLDIGLTLLTTSQSLESYRIVSRPHFVLLSRPDHGLSSSRRSLLETMQELSSQVLAASLVKLECRSVGCPIAARVLKRLVLESLSESLALPVPSEAELKQSGLDDRARKDAVRDLLLADLRRAGDGLARWNAWTEKKIPPVKHFRKIDLQGADLRGAKMTMLDFRGANFSGCKLTAVSFYGADIRNCNFSHADLSGAKISGTMHSADLTGASLAGAHLRGATLSNAVYDQADFTGCDLSYADLKGANLSRCDLKDVIFEYTKFDENTRFPHAFRQERGLVFSGQGKDPFLAERIKAVLPAGKVDFQWFIKKLEEEFDEKRLERALKMLKGESFQLFAEAREDRLVGVVRSQRKADLFYSCYLKDGGAYSCCSHSLEPCLGLRGALCKHLLVLLIGMTRAGQLDPAIASEWVLASRTRNPSMDKELVTTTLLRYKGAASGEVDWRPTETIPEDYYAF